MAFLYTGFQNVFSKCDHFEWLSVCFHFCLSSSIFSRIDFGQLSLLFLLAFDCNVFLFFALEFVCISRV